jgi:serine/threonine-protein kinase HipA
MLNNTQAAPLGNRPKIGRTSLAGVHEEIVLARNEGHWFQVLDGCPSTHIITPPSVRHPSITFDEGYGLRAAKAVGPATLNSWIEDFEQVAGLVIERSDRSPDVPEGRIHQEDLDQALARRRCDVLYAMLRDGTLYQADHTLAA